jgi:hypothetical protein
MKKFKAIFTIALIALGGMTSKAVDGVFLVDTFNPNTSFGLVTVTETSMPLDNTWAGQFFGTAVVSSPASFESPVYDFGSGGPGYLFSNTPATVTGLFFASDMVDYQLRVWNKAFGATFNDAVATNPDTANNVSAVARLTLTDSGTGIVNIQSANNFPSFSVANVPEPSTMILALLGGFGLLFRRRK